MHAHESRLWQLRPGRSTTFVCGGGCCGEIKTSVPFRGPTSRRRANAIVCSLRSSPGRRQTSSIGLAQLPQPRFMRMHAATLMGVAHPSLAGCERGISHQEVVSSSRCSILAHGVCRTPRHRAIRRDHLSGSYTPPMILVGRPTIGDSRDARRSGSAITGSPRSPPAASERPWKYLRSFRPCLVLLDIMMPRETGWDLVERHLARAFAQSTFQSSFMSANPRRHPRYRRAREAPRISAATEASRQLESFSPSLRAHCKCRCESPFRQ